MQTSLLFLSSSMRTSYSLSIDYHDSDSFKGTTGRFSTSPPGGWLCF